VLEFCEGGSLLTKLRQNAFDRAQKFKIIEEVCRGMIHLRKFLYTVLTLSDKHNIIHRDLAARNILLRANNEAVVSDFGFARTGVADDGGQTKAAVGPLRWMPPESLTNGLYSTKSDVWSFAVTVYPILTNCIGDSVATL
jgi:serine/threonine protein kinase